MSELKTNSKGILLGLGGKTFQGTYRASSNTMKSKLARAVIDYSMFKMIPTNIDNGTWQLIQEEMDAIAKRQESARKCGISPKVQRRTQVSETGSRTEANRKRTGSETGSETEAKLKRTGSETPSTYTDKGNCSNSQRDTLSPKGVPSCGEKTEWGELAFEEYWKLYPKHTDRKGIRWDSPEVDSRGKTRRIFLSHVQTGKLTKARFEKMLEALKSDQRLSLNNDPSYYPNPSNWVTDTLNVIVSSEAHGIE